ncbi:MAG: peptide/nickel transport system substrate-binding protein [Thermomicrobiales bacterium]|jgi:peptide/nickel transport system substrate-binding protein|nr:peptide/nickel transport system substrate-binding protein [Thermomicrobiales bacterium]
MAEYWNLDRLAQEWTARGLSRRDLMRLVAGGAGMTALLTVMGRGPEGVAAQGSGAQVSVLWKEPVTLNPLFSTSGSEQQVERLMFGALVKMSGDLVPTPDLSESIDVSEDAKVYTFKLKSGITFTDGQPLTSKDVAFTLERALDSRTASIWRGRLLGIEGAEAFSNQEATTISGLATPDDLTVQITLTTPDASFLPIFCNFSGLGIMPNHVLGGIAPDQLQAHPFSLAPDVTAGAYKFVRFEPNQFLEIASNPNYVGGAPAVERIFLRILTTDVGQAQLETGEIDLMSLPVSEAERVRGLANVTVVSVPSPSMDFLALNLERPYLQNKAMRQAMMHAIDREGIVKQVLQGEGTVVNSPIFGPDWMGVPEGLAPYPYDPDKAKELLASSGFDTSQALSIMHLPGTKEKDAAIAIMQEQLRQVGFKVDILQVDVAELNRRYIQEADFDLFYNAGGVFRADPGISGTYFLTRNFTPNGGNGSHYSNPTVDDLYAKGQAAPTPEERKAVYTDLAKILNDELPWIFLWSPNSLYAASNRLQGFVPPSYSDNKFWNAETWTVTG